MEIGSAAARAARRTLFCRSSLVPFGALYLVLLFPVSVFDVLHLPFVVTCDSSGAKGRKRPI